MATTKSKGGSCCAVASCKNYSGKPKNTGRTIARGLFTRTTSDNKPCTLCCIS